MATLSAPTSLIASSHKQGRSKPPQTRRYREQVAKAQYADLFALDEFPVLSELPMVAARAEAHPREMLPRGKVLRALLRRAVGDVVSAVHDAPDPRSQRLGQFVQLRYQEQQTVTAIAKQLQLTRTYVSHYLGRRATEVIAQRFLRLVEVSHLRERPCSVATTLAS